jgi:hypothetical protein
MIIKYKDSVRYSSRIKSCNSLINVIKAYYKYITACLKCFSISHYKNLLKTFKSIFEKLSIYEFMSFFQIILMLF